MCQERGGRINHAISTNLIHTLYMKHAFQEFRGTWRCITFSTKKKSANQSQADMAKTMNLQRASARAAVSRSNINLPTLGCTETSQWMYRTFNSLYKKRRSRTKDHRLSTRMKSLIKANSLDGVEDPVSGSSLTELIPSCTTDFDLGNIAMSPDSEYQTTGEPPSRRSSDSFLSPKTCDSSSILRESGSAAGPKSPLRPGRNHRRKRSIFRAAKVALTGGRGNSAGVRRHALPVVPMSSGIGIGRSRYSLSPMAMTTPTRMIEKQHPTSPAPGCALEKNLSRGTTMTMDTSSSPCKSSNTTSWLENYDMLTETLSTSSWSLRTDDPDSPSRATKLDSPVDRVDDVLDSSREPKISTDEWRRVLHEDHKQEYWFDDCTKPSSPVAVPISRNDIQKRQASAIEGARHTGKDFQEAIVDIILDNDVNDLLDLEEFLQGYFRLNSLYQDIIQQFFNDLSDDLVNPKVSRAPSVFARLAAANQKSMATVKAGGRSREL